MSPVLAISPWDLSAQQAQASRLKRTGDSREQLTEAARGFESVLIRKWIEVARKASINPKQGAAASYETMVDDQLAFLVSKQGGVGFVNPMVNQMMAQIANRVEDPTKVDSVFATDSRNNLSDRGVTP
jgi:Rod binding domain-containing protein